MNKEERFKEALAALLYEYDADIHVEENEALVQFYSGDADSFYFTDADKDFVGIDT